MCNNIIFTKLETSIHTHNMKQYDSQNCHQHSDTYQSMKYSPVLLAVMVQINHFNENEL